MEIAVRNPQVESTRLTSEEFNSISNSIKDDSLREKFAQVMEGRVIPSETQMERRAVTVPMLNEALFANLHDIWSFNVRKPQKSESETPEDFIKHMEGDPNKQGFFYVSTTTKSRDEGKRIESRYVEIQNGEVVKDETTCKGSSEIEGQEGEAAPASLEAPQAEAEAELV